MKLLLSLIVLASCSSNRDIPVTPYSAVAGHSYDMVVKGKGNPVKCVEHATTKYCDFKGSVMIFRNGIFQESLSPVAKPMTYSVSRDGLAMDGKYNKSIFVVPGRKSLSQDGIEWRRHYPIRQCLRIMATRWPINLKTASAGSTRDLESLTNLWVFR